MPRELGNQHAIALLQVAREHIAMRTGKEQRRERLCALAILPQPPATHPRMREPR